MLGLSPIIEFLFQARPLLLLGVYVLIGWLIYRFLMNRLGRLAELLLFALALLFIMAVYLSFGILFFGSRGRWDLMLRFLVARLGPTIIIVGCIIIIYLFVGFFVRPMPWWLGFVLESPLRRLFLPADLVLDRLGLGPGMKVVEVGSGPGFLSTKIAQRISPNGQLYAIDIQPKMVEKVEKKVARLGLDNVLTFAARAEQLPQEIYDADLVLFAMVLGEVKNRATALTEAFRVLKPGGVLAVSESILDPHHLTRGEVARLAARTGFDPWVIEGNFYSFTACFRKPGQFWS